MSRYGVTRSCPPLITRIRPVCSTTNCRESPGGAVRNTGELKPVATGTTLSDAGRGTGGTESIQDPSPSARMIGAQRLTVILHKSGCNAESSISSTSKDRTFSLPTDGSCRRQPQLQLQLQPLNRIQRIETNGLRGTADSSSFVKIRVRGCRFLVG